MALRVLPFLTIILPLALGACGVKNDLEPPGGAMAAALAPANPNTIPVSTLADPSKPLHPLGQRERTESATTSDSSTALPLTGP